MNTKVRKLEWLTLAGLLLVVCTVLVVALLATIRYQRTIGKPLPVYGPIADFALTNQDGQPVSLANLQGHVWLADIIFTRCAGPCLHMTKMMREIDQAIPASSSAELVSLTTDPGFDTPPVLKEYMKRRGAESKRWMFLTGKKEAVFALATGSLKLSGIAKQPQEQQDPADLFVHSTIFVVVDKHARMRGSFETSGDDIDPAKVKQQILAAIRRLDNER